MPFELHWLRPEWLWALPLVVIVPWLCRHLTFRPNGWEQLIAPHLLKALAVEQQTKVQKWRLILGLVLLLVLLALAGPSWQRLPQPAVHLKRGTVLLMDMSLSMHATDVKPDRLAQARFKAIDFANLQAEGDMALVSFAGDAFVITPLTPDHNNITLMIPMLKPEIMPVQGSDFLSALKMADKLLLQAGYSRGDVVAFTDGFSSAQATALRDYIDDYPHRLSIIAFGTLEGAPIKLEQGTLLKDHTGAIVIPRVPLEQLEQLASITGGVFTNARYDKDDIETIAKLAPLDQSSVKQQDRRFQGEQWADGAVWLMWCLLPLVAWWLRRTPLMAVVLAGVLVSHTPPSQAAAVVPTEQPAATAGASATPPSWTDSVKNFLWRTPQERAHHAYQQGDYQQAQQQFDDPTWQGNSAYRAGDYALAEQLYRQSNDPNGLFNLGNALAKQQKLPEALKAYESAKQRQPDLPGVDNNIELLKQLLKQQEQQQSGDQQNQNQQQSKQQSQQSNQQNEQQNSSQQASSQQPSGDASAEQNNDQDGTAKQKQATESAKQQQQQIEAAKQQPSTKQTKAVREAWPNATPEQTQQLDAILRKVQDDPYQLLHNKMVLEYQRRNAQAPQQGGQQEW